MSLSVFLLFLFGFAERVACNKVRYRILLVVEYRVKFPVSSVVEVAVHGAALAVFVVVIGAEEKLLVVLVVLKSYGLLFTE